MTDPASPLVTIPIGRMVLCAGCDWLILCAAGGLRYDVPGGARHTCRGTVPDHVPPPQDTR